MTNMYYGGGKKCRTWNPFVGCGFDCTYCKPTFQRQAKRQKHNCRKCYDFTPHCHPERLDRIPSAPNIFVCGNGDISFCPPEFMLPEPSSEKVMQLMQRLVDAGIEVRGKNLQGLEVPKRKAERARQ